MREDLGEHDEPGKTAMFKWRSMQALQDRNETLFYRDHIEGSRPSSTPHGRRGVPAVPRLFRRPRGCFSAEDVGHFNAMMYNWKSDVG